MLTKKRIILLLLIVAVCVVTPILGTCQSNVAKGDEELMTVINIWQIDGFEGGKGSRAQYLQNKADNLFKNSKTYAVVTSISADAARANIQNGNIPDIISYNAGFYGIEGYINGREFAYKTWCRGGYCFLALNDGADFTDITAQNTVINGGKDNLSEIAACFTGIADAPVKGATDAYLQLLNGSCKYLLGTQRDIYRLMTRGVDFKVSPVTQFNDLYQNVSILSADAGVYNLCKSFVDYLIGDCNDVDKIGMFKDGCYLYSDSLRCMENLTFDSTIKTYVSENFLSQITQALKNGDINKLKTLLK